MTTNATRGAVAALTLALLAAAPAATRIAPQTPPNPGAAEAKPRTVIGRGGATTLPAPGSTAAAPDYGSPANDDVAAVRLGPP